MNQNSTTRLNKVLLHRKQIWCSAIHVKPFMIVSLFLSMLLLGGVSAAFASDYYVRAGATGANNGADWNNAYTSLPTNLGRGNTYYIADGSYGSYTFDDAVSGSLVITVKKATASSHGTDIGWSSAYGDGQVSFSSILINTSYVTLDGNCPNGTYTIALTPSNRGIELGSSTSVSNVTVKGVTIDMTNGSSRGIYMSSGSPSKTNILIENVEVHNSEDDCVTMDNTSYLTFDHFVCRDRRNVGGGVHGDAIEMWGVNNITIRYSDISWNGQQFYWGGSSNQHHFYIYGNVFRGPSGGGATKGLHGDSGSGNITNIYVYNNTFTSLNITIDGLQSGDTGEAKNNLFYNNNTGPNWGGITQSNNTTASSNPFVGSPDFHLISTTAAGATLTSPYNADPDGNVRGSDGTWDIGAFEFTSGGTRTSRISAPSNLTIN